MRRWQMIRDILVLVYSMAVTAMSGKWIVKYAFMERGYYAIGGEYIFIPVVAYAAYKIINIFFNELEELKYEQNCQKGRG